MKNSDTIDLNFLKEFLEENYYRYNTSAFIENDPICVPHLFSKKEDIEIAGFFAATLAWGNRKSIIKNAQKLMELMDQSPYEFVTEHDKKHLKAFENFVHRTFNGKDCVYFIKALKTIYLNHGGIETAFSKGDTFGEKISAFRKLFFEGTHLCRTEKHLSDPLKKSSAKRLCMYARWMVRKDKKGVDFGIWNQIKPSELCLPLDVHTGTVARTLGLLKRKQNDWRAVEEITAVLRSFDKNDPVKYDFALFGLGVNGVMNHSENDQPNLSL